MRVFPIYAPRTNPCEPITESCGDPDPYTKNEPIAAEFQDFLAFKNGFSGVITEKSGFVSLRNIIAIENKVGLEISTSDLARDNNARIIDSKVVGYVEELFEPTWEKHIGIVTSGEEGMSI